MSKISEHLKKQTPAQKKERADRIAKSKKAYESSPLQLVTHINGKKIKKK